MIGVIKMMVHNSYDIWFVIQHRLVFNGERYGFFTKML